MNPNSSNPTSPAIRPFAEIPTPPPIPPSPSSGPPASGLQPPPVPPAPPVA